MIIKKYGNRRLYDTEGSRYITQDALASIIRAGHDVRVIDAKTNADLTQATLTQIILESRGGARLLPVPLLLQLIRLGDDALAEFFGRYVAWALEVYGQVKQGTSMLGGGAFSPFDNPFANALGAMNPLTAFARMTGPWSDSGGQQPSPSPAPPTPPPPAASTATDLAALRRELDELRRSVQGEKKKRRKPT